MDIIHTPESFQKKSWEWRTQGLCTALVPTMGFLHEGHLSLIRHARQHADKVMVSIFVNPTQFGPNEDLDAYPRDFERDSQRAESAGADLIFAPGPETMYTPNASTWVTVQGPSQGLCAATRPTHFRGVSTVVAKLFMLAMPHLAVFGKKDYQQLAVIRRMVRDLNIPVEIHGHPIVREDDGLAMSSRNVYLSEEERECAPHLHKGLVRLRDQAVRGERRADALTTGLAAYYAQHIPQGRIDYIEVVDPDTMIPQKTITRRAVAAVAVFLGKARLIDNIEIEVS
jgi:pantoate--beta-alanine ligase